MSLSRLKNHTGTVHYATDGRTACGPLGTHRSWLAPTLNAVTCQRCIALHGADHDGQPDPPLAVNEHVARRAAERAERMAQRATR